jgi:hypothetical protein
MTDLAKLQMSSTDAQVLTLRIRHGIDELDAALREAVEGRIHIALGYETLTDWWVAEVGSARLSGEVRDTWIRQLKADRPDMDQRAIGAAVGTSQPTVHRVLNPRDSDESNPTPGPADTTTWPVDPGTTPAPVTPEPGAASSTAPSGSGPAGVASTRGGVATPALEWWRWTCFGCRTPFEGTDNACPHCGGRGTNRKPIDPEPMAPPREDQVEVGRRSAETLVATMQVEVAIIITAVDLGEYLVTEQLIADLRIAVDLLESRLGGCE